MPDPASRSTNASDVTGAVCPLNSCNVFPVCLGGRRSVSAACGDRRGKAHLERELADDGRIFRDPRDASANLYRQGLSGNRDRRPDVLCAPRLVLAGL